VVGFCPIGDVGGRRSLTDNWLARCLRWRWGDGERHAGISGPVGVDCKLSQTAGMHGCPGRDRTPELPIALRPLKSLRNFTRIAALWLGRLLAPSNRELRENPPFLEIRFSSAHWTALAAVSSCPQADTVNSNLGVSYGPIAEYLYNLVNSSKRCQPDFLPTMITVVGVCENVSTCSNEKCRSRSSTSLAVHGYVPIRASFSAASAWLKASGIAPRTDITSQPPGTSAL
jgi:hypothetical protein